MVHLDWTPRFGLVVTVLVGTLIYAVPLVGWRLNCGQLSRWGSVLANLLVILPMIAETTALTHALPESMKYLIAGVCLAALVILVGLWRLIDQRHSDEERPPESSWHRLIGGALLPGGWLLGIFLALFFKRYWHEAWWQLGYAFLEGGYLFSACMLSRYPSEHL